MKNYFLAGLQRTGSNYILVTLQNNIKNINIQANLFDPEASACSSIRFWKHDFPDPYIKKQNVFKVEGIILNTINPYMWLEKLCYTNDIKEMAKEVAIRTKTPLEEAEDLFGLWSDFQLDNYSIMGKSGLQKLNKKGLLNLFKDFHLAWLGSNIIKDRLIVRYEDCLDINKFKDLCKNNNFELPKNGPVLPNKPVKWSPSFTQKDFEYAKKEIPKKLTKEEIELVNSILGTDFIEQLGYKVIQ